MSTVKPAAQRLRVLPLREGDSATSIELFFDLVFVFALTQVTASMADDLTPTGLFRGLLVVALLWWSWVGYSWLANLFRADEGATKLVLLASMAAMLMITLAIPEAFEDLPGGVHGPTVVALGYLVFRMLHLLLYWLVADGDALLRRQIAKFAPSVLVATALLLVAAQLDGMAQTLLWVAALAADYGGTYLAGATGWRLASASHFAERHGLIVIVALGESIVAIGVGIAALPISVPIMAGALLGLTLAAALWWAYFDVSQRVGERALAATDGAQRAALGRDAYSFWHLPLITGVVFLALGIKKVLEYAGNPAEHDLADPVDAVAVFALCAGVALYLLAMVGFAWRTVRHVKVARLVAAGVCLAVIPAGLVLPALVTLALMSAIAVGLAAFETVRFAERRDALRHAEESTSASLEAGAA